MQAGSAADYRAAEQSLRSTMTVRPPAAVRWGIARAAAGEVLVSQTVKDLVTGSGIGFEDRGLSELKGVSGRLYAVISP